MSGIVHRVNPGLLRILVYVVITAQVLLSAPVISAISADNLSSSMPCAELMAETEDPCPCCPDDGGVAACLSACTASVGAVSSLYIQPTRVTGSDPQTVPPVFLTSTADPPLKPPPIS
jgi:hypothetical protein